MKRVDLKDKKLWAGPLALFEGHARRLESLSAHGNRKLHIDQLVIGLLLSFFNPVVRSLRLIEDCGSMNGRLDLSRLARSTTADALASFDPSVLLPALAELREKSCGLRQRDASLATITQEIIAADGTLLNTFSDVTWALLHRKRDGKPQRQVRLNVQMEVSGWLPRVISVSGDDGSEPEAFAADLLRDVLYVLDRNFLDFSFLKKLLEKDNNFVLRVRDNAPLTQVLRERPIDQADQSVGVQSDQIVRLSGRDAPAGEFRLLTIATTNRKGEPDAIKLLGSLVDGQTPARVIAAIYRLRWQIELFFKWLKTWATMDHLFSTSRNGITLQFYVAVIAVLLLHVQTGRRVSRYALAALHNYLHGQITWEQVLAIIERREREKDRAKERAAARNAK